METLKNCPFCGSESVEADSNRAYRALVGGTLGKAAAIHCDACDAEMMRCYADMPDVPREDVMADLIETWNRRTTPSDDSEWVRVRRDDLDSVRIELYGWSNALYGEYNDPAGVERVEALIAKLAAPAPDNKRGEGEDGLDAAKWRELVKANCGFGDDCWNPCLRDDLHDWCRAHGMDLSDEHDAARRRAEGGDEVSDG